MLRAHKLPIGETVGRWTILERLGRGAVASVYRARDDSDSPDVALKVLHADPHEEETHSVDRLQREIKLAQRISDPGVCRIFELETLGDLLFLVMEFIPGRSLRNILEEGCVPQARAGRILHGVAEGLAAAHEHEILHRDLKPGNIMVRPDDAAAILDFGYAIAPDVTRVTKKGSWVGTLAYAAPELLKNQSASTLSDIYSLGVILYECIAGELPFVGHSYGELASAILFRDVVPPSRLAVGVDPRLDAIIMRTISRDPEGRFTGADELALALAEILPELVDGEPTLTSVQALVEPADLPERESSENTAVNVEVTIPEARVLPEVTVPEARVPPEVTVPEARVPPEVTVPEARVPPEATVPEARSPTEPTEPTEPQARVPAEPTEPQARAPEPTEPGAQAPAVPTPQAAHDRLAVHKRLADLSAALMRERKAKGVIQGDVTELDGLEKTAQEELRQGNWTDTIDCLERALERARGIMVDQTFLLAKIQRFDDTLVEKAQPHNLDHFRGLLNRARAALEHGDLASANLTLNHAFDTLRAK